VLSFNIQAFLAIAISFYSYLLDWKKDQNSIKATLENRLELQPWQMRKRIANKILVKGSDVQSMNGKLLSRESLNEDCWLNTQALLYLSLF